MVAHPEKDPLGARLGDQIAQRAEEHLAQQHAVAGDRWQWLAKIARQRHAALPGQGADDFQHPLDDPGRVHGLLEPESA